MKYVMVYEVAADGRAKAREHFAAHRARLDRFHGEGTLLMAGMLDDGTALGIFTTRAAADEFVREDPFVTGGVVAKVTIREWNEVLAP